MDYEEFVESLQGTDSWDCTCFNNPPCHFCTDTVQNLYEEYLEGEK